MASTMAQNLTRGDLIVPDDDMEISSDAGRGADDTIDIDIDFDVPQAQPGDDDYMVDDNPSAVKADPTPSSVLPSDSMMFDEEGHEQTQDDGMMEDDPEAHDEELLDASDSEDPDAEVTEITVYDQPQIDDDATQQPLKPVTTTNDAGDPQKQNIETIQGDAKLEIQNQPLDADQNENEISYALPNEELDKIIQKNGVVDDSGLSVENNLQSLANESVSGEIQYIQEVSNEPTEEDPTASLAFNDATEQPPKLEDLAETDIAREDHYAQEGHNPTGDMEAPAEQVETSTGRATDEAEPSTAHDTDGDEQGSPYKSHPVVVLYEGSEVHLFPPAESNDTATYFLNDESLVDASLKDLLGEFRTVLGDSITNNEELELEIGILGLSITENSSEATLSTLANILDVYCRLCQLDQILDSNGSPHSLHVVLRTKVRFSARVSQFYDLIAEGKGLSHLHFISSFDEDNQEDVDEGGDGQLQQPTDEQELSNPADITAPSVGHEEEGSYHAGAEKEHEEIAEDTNIGVANEPDRVQNGQEILQESPRIGTEPSTKETEEAAQEEQNDDLIDYTEGEDDNDDGHETSATSTTLRGDDQAASHQETTFDANNELSAETVDTHQNEDNAETNVEDLSYHQEEFGDSLEQGTDLHDEFADEEYYVGQDNAEDDVGFNIAGSEAGRDPELDGKPEENEHLAQDSEAFLNADDQWEGNDDEFLELPHENADDLEEEELDESEFLHDDEQEAHGEHGDEITAGTTSDDTAPLPHTSSRKRSFAEHDGQEDGAEDGNDVKRSKPA